MSMIFVFFVYGLAFFLLGEANVFLLITGLVDLVFAILFMEFLVKGRFKLKAED